MRRLAVIIAALAVAACASGTQSKPPARIDDSASIAASVPTMTEEELKDYVSERAEERLLEVCGEERTISRQLTCVRDATLRGFDTTGEAQRNCDADAPLEPMLHCVIIGSLGYQLATEAKLEQASNYDWSDPEGAMKEAIESLATQTVSGCMAVPLSEVDGCVVQKIGRSFALSEQVVTACTDDADSAKSLDCLMRAHVIQQFESAFQRMGPGPGEQA
jgi:hypothetical protein